MEKERPACKRSVLQDVAWVEQDNVHLKRKEEGALFQACCFGKIGKFTCV